MNNFFTDFAVIFVSCLLVIATFAAVGSAAVGLGLLSEHCAKLLYESRECSFIIGFATFLLECSFVGALGYAAMKHIERRKSGGT